MNLNLGPYAKFITAAAGLAVTVLTQKYGGTTWLPYVVAVAAALGVYGVPNTPVMTQLTAIAGDVKSLPEPTHLHIHLDTGQPAPIVKKMPPVSYGGVGGASGSIGGGSGGSPGYTVSGSIGYGGQGSSNASGPEVVQPPEFFQSETPDTPAPQSGSPSTAAGSAPVE